MSEITEEMLNPDHKFIESTKKLPGWRISGRQPRRLYKSRGFVLNKVHKKYFEAKPIRKKGKKIPAVQIPLYENPLFSPWQQRFSKLVHDGHHLILDVATSCGKTFCTSQVIAYEVLSRDTCTALFIAPNPEILRENVSDICKNNWKRYNYHTQMLNTQSRNFCTYEDLREPGCQIICVTVENFKSFVTNELNIDFIKNLRYVVFDEAHLSQIAESFWWTQFLPQNAQLILLSATLGDTEMVKEIVKQAVLVDPERERPISVIAHGIRPIPLQYTLFKGCEEPKEGIISSNLTKAKRLGCVVNRHDPTERDMKSINPDIVVPDDRTIQYEMGHDLIETLTESDLDKKLDAALLEADVDYSPANLYKLLSYLFSNEMQPVLVFLPSSGKTHDMVNSLIAVIHEYERADPEYRQAEKLMEKIEKHEKKNRDTHDNDLLFTGEKRDSKKPKVRSSSQKIEAEKNRAEPVQHKETLTAADLETQLKKWKFPNHVENIPKNSPQWIQDALEYGIGVYTDKMSMWMRYTIFDMFKEGKLNLLLSDASISVGINLPVRTCVLCGDMTPSLFRQTGGRAGRRGFDTKGFIIPMFDKDTIRTYFKQNIPPVSIVIPNKMSYTDLIRLTTPKNLDSYIHDEARDPNLRPKALEARSPLKESILATYLGWCKDPNILTKLDIIHKEKWNYHRLTNMLKMLPYDESMIFVKLLMTGVLHSMSISELIQIIGVLFEKVPGDTIQELPGNTQLRILKYSMDFDIPIDEKPIDDYFYRFCHDGEYSIKYRENINNIGNWIYMLRTQVDLIAPETDKFRILINKVDEMFLSSCKKSQI